MKYSEWLKALKAGDPVVVIYDNGARVVNLTVTATSNEVIRIGHECSPENGAMLVFVLTGRGDGFVIGPPPTQPERTDR